MSRCFFHWTHWFYHVVNKTFSPACNALRLFLVVSCVRFQGESRITAKTPPGFHNCSRLPEMAQKRHRVEEIANNRKYNGMHKLL